MVTAVDILFAVLKVQHEISELVMFAFFLFT